MLMFLVFKNSISGSPLNPGKRLTALHSLHTNEKDAKKAAKEVVLIEGVNWYQPKVWFDGPFEVPEDTLKKILDNPEDIYYNIHVVND